MTSSPYRPRARISVAAVVGLALALALSPAGPAEAVGANPYAAGAGHIDPASQAAAAARREPDRTRAVLLRTIAGQPQFAWFGTWTPSPRTAVQSLVRDARSSRRLPQVVVYALPHLDCSGGGLGGPAYRTWVREVAAGLRGGPSVVVVEPDALAMLDCLSPAAQRERLSLLRDALAVLRAAGATTYIDAGHAGWHSPAVMAGRLRAADVTGARGVALNVSNYGSTITQARYAAALAAEIPGLHAVIDTSRNGRGGLAGQWCNVADQGLGTRPRRAADPVVDALVWVKRPGESDGHCGRGEPVAGQFWSAYAVGLAQRAAG
ncbi:MAG: glycoside hydrolase family 6 protein [Frankiales bacterium]|nr:glycoside hydrolase family 6 protein [Frankiales bacterium]